MAATVTRTSENPLGTRWLVTGTISFTGDTSYPTGGEAFTPSQVGLYTLDDISIRNTNSGYMPVWNGSKTAPKLMVFYGDNNNASDGPLIEVPNATDLSAQTGFQFTAIGRR